MKIQRDASAIGTFHVKDSVMSINGYRTNYTYWRVNHLLNMYTLLASLLVTRIRPSSAVAIPVGPGK